MARTKVKVMIYRGHVSEVHKFMSIYGYIGTAVRCGSSDFFNRRASMRIINGVATK